MAIRKKKDEPKEDALSRTDLLLTALLDEIQGLRADVARAAVLGGTVAKVGPRGLPDDAIRSLVATSNKFADVAKGVE